MNEYKNQQSSFFKWTKSSITKKNVQKDETLTENSTCSDFKSSHVFWSFWRCQKNDHCMFD